MYGHLEALVQGYGRIFFNDTSCWVRFERVGEGVQFDMVLDAFRARFPKAVWDNDYRAWVLPTSMLNDVLRFTRALFGMTGVKLQYIDTTFSSTRQLSLSL